MIKTTRVKNRRTLHFDSMQDVVDDVIHLDSSQVRALGNWAPAQILQHVAKMINFSIDGFPAKAPLPLRIAGKMLRNRSMTKGFQPGFKFSRKFAFLEPAPDIEWDEALTYLRESIGRLQNERMTARSPVFGPLTHAQWEKMHCRHAEMHFSFIAP